MSEFNPAAYGLNVFMTIKIQTVAGELTASFVSYIDCDYNASYTAWFHEKPITVDHNSVDECIETLHEMLDFMMEYEKEMQAV